MKTNHILYPTTQSGKVLIGGMWFRPDDSRHFSAATSQRAFFDEDDGRLVVKDSNGNYAHSTRKFRSESEFNRISGWANY